MKKNIAKNLTLAILTILTIVGIVTLFIPSLEMDRFEKLCHAIAVVFVPLVTSIGINSGISKFKESKNP